MSMILSFRRLMYAQVILGVIAYAVAEQSAVMVLVAGTLGTLSWYVVEGPRGKPLPRWLINLGVLCVTAWLFYSQVTRQQELILGLGEFILFIQIFKLYERKSNRDYAQLIVLRRMQMICAAIISAEIVFGILLIIYLVLTLFTLLQFQLKMGYDEVSEAGIKQAPPGQRSTRPKPVVSRGHRRHFNLVAACCGIGAMALSAVVFVAMPRGEGKGLLGDWSPPTRRNVSGFDDTIELTSGTHIATSRVPVMNITLTRDGQPYGSDDFSFLVRGTSLDRYDRASHRWTRSTRGDHALDMDAQGAAVLAQVPDRTPILSQQITLRAQTHGVLFSAYPPVRIVCPQVRSMLFNVHDQVLSARQPAPPSIQYTVDALAEPTLDMTPMYAQLEERGGAAPLDTDRERVLDSPRLRAEALRILRVANLSRDPKLVSTPQDMRIAAAIEQYLQTHMAYTLDLPAVPDGTDPIMAFLFEHQRGHCEYFASAMTALLRSIGVTSRVVTGFRATEFNSVGGYYVVREKNAHAWVEAYQPGVGWRAFDPSPPLAIERLHAPGSGLLALVRDLYEYMEFHWINGVITYDANQRRSVMVNIDSNLNSVTRAGQSLWESIVAWIKDFRERWTFGFWGYVLIVIVLGSILSGIVLLVHTILRRRRYIRQLQLEIAPRKLQRRLAQHLEFYVQMLKVLEKAGFSKPLWQTPASFAEHLTHRDPDRFETVVPLTDLFYEIRFGGRPLDADRARRIGRHLERLRRTMRVMTSG
ncbi:MAG: DUF3488 domain-containing protein [Planctomycetes bacterium]|nr:DUF3488 domain-containing protein [Planctomycetota bacterium]